MVLYLKLDEIAHFQPETKRLKPTKKMNEIKYFAQPQLLIYPVGLMCSVFA
jgi:nitrate reductase NapE component